MKRGSSMHFLKLAPQFRDPENSRIAILPVPYDGTSTWIKGADKGPEALLDASATLELYDIETDSEVYRHGIFTDAPVAELSSPEAMIEGTHRRASELMAKGKFVVTIGGEHSVSIGPTCACAERFGNLSVLQLDAHADLREEYHGSRFNHGCVMARALEKCPIVQVGIRSMDIAEKTAMREGSVFYAHDIVGDDDAWMQAVVDRLTANVYLTVDLDVFDPSIVPSTGTPEPGGLQWYPVLKLLRTLARQRNVAACDVVELCPNPRNRAPDFLAAKLVYKILSYKFR
jgi:agmatinase